MELDRAYVINGDDLRIALSEAQASVPNMDSRESAEHILGKIAVAGAAVVSRAQLSRALEGLTLWVAPVDGQDTSANFASTLINPAATAQQILTSLGQLPCEAAEPVVDAHIHCEHVLDGPASDELEAMDKIAALLRTRSDRAVKRILAWSLDRLTDIGEPPF